MSQTDSSDRWATWVLRRGHGGDAAGLAAKLAYLSPIRDRVLDAAVLDQGDVLLDLGVGDGLIAFGALDRVGPAGQVVFTDVSQELLDHCAIIAEELQAGGRCEFLRTSAADLSGVPDGSVQAVTSRSVLIYLPFDDKRRAFTEAWRVLSSGGRLSIFEPLNSWFYPPRPGWFAGYDLRPVAQLASKLRAASELAQPPDRCSLLDFGARDLVAFAERAGFDRIAMDVQVEVAPGSWPRTWQSFLEHAPNPLAPTMRELINNSLDVRERERLAVHLRPQVESGSYAKREAVAYLSARKA